MPSLITSFVHTLPPLVAACLNTFPADLAGGAAYLDRYPDTPYQVVKTD